MGYRHILNQEVTVTNTTGSNDYGEPTGGTAKTVPARVDFVNKVRQTPSGETIVITAKVLLMPDVTIEAGDKIVFDNNNFRVEGKISVPGSTGKIEAMTVECSEWR